MSAKANGFLFHSVDHSGTRRRQLTMLQRYSVTRVCPPARPIRAPSPRLPRMHVTAAWLSVRLASKVLGNMPHPRCLHIQ